MNPKPRIQRLLMLAMVALLGCFSAFAQSTLTVSGQVFDQTDEPIIGASVIVKGTSIGVTTDIDGNFRITNVPADATIVFSYIGTTTKEIPAKDTQALARVVLADDAQLLDDVVVVGYGVMKKKDLTGAIAQIDPEKLADQNPKSVQDVLRGTPGLQIGIDNSAKGSGASITLRGKSALATDAQPLIVLDGMTFYGELSEINPDDIERIDVLKDASSAAIYGAKGAAGVIIITTKTGKEGKPVINVTANWGFANKSAYRDFFTADKYLQWHEDWYKMQYTYGQGEDGLYGYYNAGDAPRGYYDNPNNVADKQAWANSGSLQIMEGESFMSLYTRRMQYDLAPYVQQNILNGTYMDWGKKVFRTGVNQDYNASVSGAFKNSNYYLSVGYTKNQGVVQGNDYSAFRANMKIHSALTSWLEVGANVNFQNRTDGDIQVSLGSNYWDNNMYRNSPYSNLMKVVDGKTTNEYEQYPMSGLPTNGGYNYYFDRQYYDLNKGYTVLNSIFNVQVNLPFGIKYQFNIAPRFQWFHDNYWMSAELPNSTAADRGVNRENSRWFEWNLNNQLIWDRTFNDIHHVTLTLVQEAEDHKYYSTRVEARNITPTDVLGWHYIDGANKEQSNFSSYDSHSSAASYLGRAFYSFKDRYMITGSFRRDGYSGFGINNQWGNFGSVGIGWNFSEEKWFESWKTFFNQGKLRVSYGTNGNRDFSSDIYATLAKLQTGNVMVYPGYPSGGNTVVQSLVVSNLAAPNLMWEKTKSWNVGIDFGFFNYRLRGSIDWYYKDTNDMVLQQRLPSFTGFSSTFTNLGQVTNTGVEIALNSVNIDNRDFTWSTSMGFSYNKNTIKHIYYDYDENGKELDDTSNGWYIGHPIGEIWYYETDGVWQNTPEDIKEAARYGQVPGDPKVINHCTEDDIINEDGTRSPVFNDKDKVYLGTTTPPIYWNMRNDFTFFKSLTFSFSMYSYLGHKSIAGYWLNDDNGGSMVTNGFNVPAKEYWTPDNATNEYCRLQAKGPKNGLAGGASKLYNRNFLRIDNISLGYIIPQSFTRRFQVEKIRVSASINNVCTISKWKYGDPETGGLGVRTFNLGLNITI